MALIQSLVTLQEEKPESGDDAGRRPCEDRAWEWSDADTDQRAQGLRPHQKLGPGTLVSGFWPPDLREQLCVVLWHLISGPQVPPQGEPGLEAQQSVPRQHWHLEITPRGLKQMKQGWGRLLERVVSPLRAGMGMGRGEVQFGTCPGVGPCGCPRGISSGESTLLVRSSPKN